jgi:co-chaperonin GroES (HSP10)
MKTQLPTQLQNIKFTTWSPQPNWLILLPSRVSNKLESGIVLPDDYAKKGDQGICILVGSDMDSEFFLGKECFFSKHTQYEIKDSDTGYLFYVIETNKIIMVRQPTQEVLTHSRKIQTSGFTMETITHS